ncbi:SpoIID/LytB domain-containing protein [Paracrocinitomix mangrovi]|uniref:SpoIID/LytB domain-containing protein n=1 Tax=Paracrocinitomix mangrovi TaxID=2862509 RepID=UPI001C8E859E|nr:SpoIID/LytB domain-containing protein [Paracrocinitomix mangrovi]UKN01329.1 SpoIID/LytB domain-containing protein [Paracrocinitomix mangrovi]
MKQLLFYIALIFSFSAQTQELKVGILRAYDLSAVRISYNEGTYNVYGDSTELTSIWSGQSIECKRSGDKIKLVKDDKTLGTFDTVYFRGVESGNSFRIRPTSPYSKKERKYKDNIMLIPSGNTEITVINEVMMENYLPGVIESEGGGGKHIEYYKVQAILSRTYVLDHLSKHRKDGFYLCDRQHCQAYHNMMRFTPDIQKAVNETAGIIMLDHQLELADGYFFANCGGQTSESDFVWNNPVPYCRSIVDTFCIRSWQANWTKKIPKSSWKNYLVQQFGYPVNDSIFGQYLYAFSQPNRKAFYIDPRLGIPLRDIRTEFKLKSTWFDCHLEGDNVVLEGKGFGHGVGLCQEGAMSMAKLGYSYEQILKFYFTDIQLFDYFHWLFLRQEEMVGL